MKGRQAWGAGNRGEGNGQGRAAGKGERRGDMRARGRRETVAGGGRRMERAEERGGKGSGSTWGEEQAKALAGGMLQARAGEGSAGLDSWGKDSR